MLPYNKEAECTLLARTRGMIQQSNLKPHDIFKETGLPFYWLVSFSKGTAKDPSVNRVQYLYEYLAKKQLDVNP
jgi:hypothetical protein